MKIKQSLLCKKFYEMDFDVNPTKVNNSLVNGYYSIRDLHLENLPKPLNEYDKQPVEGSWEIDVSTIIDENTKFMVPCFYNKLEFSIRFVPEDSNKYEIARSLLRLNLLNQSIKLEFSGTRGLWYL